MFATGAQNTSNNVNQYAFNTMNNNMQKPQGVEFNWNASNNNQKPVESQGITLNTTQGVTLNTTQEQPIDVSNFSTLQGLFATNVLGNQPINLATTSSIQQQQPQTFLKQ